MMDENSITDAGRRTPDLIAGEIIAIKAQTGKILLVSVVEVGRRLAEAKEIIPYGEFGQWLAEAVNYSEATAYKLMRIAEEYGPALSAYSGDSVNAAPVFRLGYSQAYALLGLPAEERAEFIAELDLEEITVSGLKKAVEERNKAREEKAALQKDLEGYKGKVSSLTEERSQAKKEMEKKQQEVWAEQGKVTLLQRELTQLKDESAAARRLEELEREAKIARLNQSMAQADAHYDLILKGFAAMFTAINEMASTDPEACKIFVIQANEIISKTQKELKSLERKILPKKKISTETIPLKPPAVSQPPETPGAP